MKANPRSRAITFPALFATALAASANLCGCVPPPPSMPAPRQNTPPSPRPRATTPPPAASAADWRDAPQTPGDWTYTSGTGGSIASFGGGVFAVQCNPGKSGVTLVRSGVAVSDPSPSLSVLTSTGTRALNGSATTRGITVTLQPRDSVLDAMAFSRGRFAVAIAGQPTLFLPSWTEISRVIEDCR